MKYKYKKTVERLLQKYNYDLVGYRELEGAVEVQFTDDGLSWVNSKFLVELGALTDAFNVEIGRCNDTPFEHGLTATAFLERRTR